MTELWIIAAATVAGIFYAEFRRHRYWRQYWSDRGFPMTRTKGAMRGKRHQQRVGFPPFPSRNHTRSCSPGSSRRAFLIRSIYRGTRLRGEAAARKASSQQEYRN
jgi:hypothetical protein